MTYRNNFCLRKKSFVAKSQNWRPLIISIKRQSSLYTCNEWAYRNSWTLDAKVGCWTLDSGRWTLDAGCWTLDARLWTLDAGLWTLDAGLWTLDSGRWTLDAGLWSLTLDSGPWTLDSRRWTLDAGIWTLGSGRWNLDSGRWIRWKLDCFWILDVKTWRSTVNPLHANVLFLFNHLKISKTRVFRWHGVNFNLKLINMIFCFC